MPPKILERSRPRVSVLDFEPARVKSFLQEKLIAIGVQEAYLFGSFARGECSPWSDLDIVAIKPSNLPFLDRPREFTEIFDLGLPVHLLVYTPQEFVRLRAEATPFWKEFEKENERII